MLNKTNVLLSTICIVVLSVPSATRAATVTILATQNIGQAYKSALLDVAGELYGASTSSPSAQHVGSVFKINSSTGRAKVLYDFVGTPDGAGPWPGSPLIDIKGHLFGTTQIGGNVAKDGSTYGVVFSVNASTGAEDVVYRFTGDRDGASPEAPLLQVGGLLYGTTFLGGGAGNRGTIYSIDPSSGNESVVYRFAGKDGSNPQAAFTEVGSLLYSTTYAGGLYKNGTLFSFDPVSKAEHTLHSFGAGNDGQQPNGVLKVGNALYGTTYAGGANGGGTVFKVDLSSGVETVLYSFTGNSDGAGPEAPLVQFGALLYGTTTRGGSGAANGTIYSINPDTGAEQTVHSFPGGLGGSDPNAALIGVGSALYGSTAFGGSTKVCGRAGCGVVYKLTP